MKFTNGSILSIAPDRGWKAVFTSIEGESWERTIIGWATVVRWSDHHNDDVSPVEAGEHETEIQPVILVHDRYPTPLHEYLRHHIDDENVAVAVTRNQ